jgi:hypothetical protein
MRESTEWFETLLRSYRNEFVVHDTRFNMFGVMSGPSHTPRLWKTRYVDMTKWDSHLKMLITLRDKYLNKIPGLDTVSVNLYDLVDFLDSHSSTINPEDLHTLREIRVFVGGKLPDLVELAEHIQKFLLFFGTHFRDAMSPKA